MSKTYKLQLRMAEVEWRIAVARCGFDFDVIRDVVAIGPALGLCTSLTEPRSDSFASI